MKDIKSMNENIKKKKVQILMIIKNDLDSIKS